MSEFRDPADVGDPFDLDPRSTSDAYVHVLASRADPRVDLAGAARQVAEVLRRPCCLIGGHHIRIGDRLDQRYPQPIG